MKRHAAMLIALSAIATTPALASDEAHAHPQYGKIQFPTSCNPAPQSRPERERRPERSTKSPSR